MTKGNDSKVTHVCLGDKQLSSVPRLKGTMEIHTDCTGCSVDFRQNVILEVLFGCFTPGFLFPFLPDPIVTFVDQYYVYVGAQLFR
jgi:hypothetical protein